MIEWLGIGHLFELTRTEAILGFFTPLVIYVVFFLVQLMKAGGFPATSSIPRPVNRATTGSTACSGYSVLEGMGVLVVGFDEAVHRLSHDLNAPPLKAPFRPDFDLVHRKHAWACIVGVSGQHLLWVLRLSRMTWKAATIPFMKVRNCRLLRRLIRP